MTHSGLACVGRTLEAMNSHFYEPQEPFNGSLYNEKHDIISTVLASGLVSQKSFLSDQFFFKVNMNRTFSKQFTYPYLLLFQGKWTVYICCYSFCSLHDGSSGCSVAVSHHQHTNSPELEWLRKRN